MPHESNASSRPKLDPVRVNRIVTEQLPLMHVVLGLESVVAAVARIPAVTTMYTPHTPTTTVLPIAH